MLELYRIIQGNTDRATITSSSDDVVFNGVTYVATAVKRSKILSRPNLLQNNVTIQLSVHDQLGLRLLMPVNKNLSNRLIIYRGADVGSLVQIWGGSLIQQGCSGESVNFVYGGGGVSIRQLGDRRPFQRRCPFVLYDTLTCRATPQTSSARVTAVNTTNDIFLVSGLDSFDVGYFTGGVLCPNSVYSADNVGNRFISSHNKTATGSQLRVSVPYSLNVGDEISVLAGCDRTWQTCYGKFNNIVNFGGFPFLPLEDPFVAEVCSDDGAVAPDPAPTDPMPEPMPNGNGNGNGLDDGEYTTPPSLSGVYNIVAYLDFSNAVGQNINFSTGNPITRFQLQGRLLKSFWDRVVTACAAGGGSANMIVGTYATYSGGSQHAFSTRDVGRPSSESLSNTITTLSRQIETFGWPPAPSHFGYHIMGFAPLNITIGTIFGYPRGADNALSYNFTLQQAQQNVTTFGGIPTIFGQATRQSTSIPARTQMGGRFDYATNPILQSSDKRIVIIFSGTPIATTAEGAQGRQYYRHWPDDDPPNDAEEARVYTKPTTGDIVAFEYVKQSPLVRGTAPFASPNNIKTYGVSINGQAIATKLAEIVNSGATVPAIGDSYQGSAPTDPALLYKTVFIDGGADD